MPLFFSALGGGGDRAGVAAAAGAAAAGAAAVGAAAAGAALARWRRGVSVAAPVTHLDLRLTLTLILTLPQP